MSDSGNQERLDALLALALAFGESDWSSEETNDSNGKASEKALQLLKELGVSETAELVQRANLYERLDSDKQVKWMKRTLGRARVRGRAVRLDEQIHPSHLAQALRGEPIRVQSLVLKNLPKHLAEQIASELGISLLVQEYFREYRETPSHLPEPEIALVAQRAFLSNFITMSELYPSKPLDSLSSLELAQFIHLIGVRETAIACRGIAEMETIAAFLRRFSDTDARAIATHISKLENLKPDRVVFAEKLVQDALSIEHHPSVILDRVGINMIVIALAKSSEDRLRYTLQKLPVEAAMEIKKMFDTARKQSETLDEEERAMRNAVIREVENLATIFRKQYDLG